MLDTAGENKAAGNSEIRRGVRGKMKFGHLISMFHQATCPLPQKLISSPVPYLRRPAVVAARSILTGERRRNQRRRRKGRRG